MDRQSNSQQLREQRKPESSIYGAALPTSGVSSLSSRPLCAIPEAGLGSSKAVFTPYPALAKINKCPVGPEASAGISRPTPFQDLRVGHVGSVVTSVDDDEFSEASDHDEEFHHFYKPGFGYKTYTPGSYHYRRLILKYVIVLSFKRISGPRKSTSRLVSPPPARVKGSSFKFKDLVKGMHQQQCE